MGIAINATDISIPNAGFQVHEHGAAGIGLVSDVYATHPPRYLVEVQNNQYRLSKNKPALLDCLAAPSILSRNHLILGHGKVVAAKAYLVVERF
jgi:hypothetical protein